MTTQPTAAATQANELIAADAAALNPPMADGDNVTAVKLKVLERIEVLGRQAARGQASLTNVALMFASAVREKLLTAEDAKSVYDTYAKGLNDMVDGKLSSAGLERIVPSKVSVSMLRSFGNPGPVANPDLYQRVLAVLNTVPKDDRVGSTYNCFVTVNRRLQDGYEVSKLIDAAQFKVTDEMLAQWLTKKERAEKDDGQRLADAIAALGKLVKTGRFVGLDHEYDRLVVFHGAFVAGTNKPHAGLVRSVELAGIEGSTVVH